MRQDYLCLLFERFTTYSVPLQNTKQPNRPPLQLPEWSTLMIALIILFIQILLIYLGTATFRSSHRINILQTPLH